MYKSKRIIIRADGNSEIGLGHVYRCVSIAERFQNEFHFFFAIQESSDELKALISRNAELIELPLTKNYLGEAKCLSHIASRKNIQAAILDGYNFSTEYQRALRESQLKVISIDDYQPFFYVADVVINHAPGINARDISTASYTQVFTGLDYALLRKPFLDEINETRTINSIDQVFICFGGADPVNITKKVVIACMASGMFKQINVIIGSAYIHETPFLPIAEVSSIIKIHKDVNVHQMVNLMKDCQLAIVPASTIALEAFMLRMFLLTGITADNQYFILDGLTKQKNVRNIGNFNNVCEEEITKVIKDLITTFQPISMPAVSNSADEKLKLILNSII